MHYVEFLPSLFTCLQSKWNIHALMAHAYCGYWPDALRIWSLKILVILVISSTEMCKLKISNLFFILLNFDINLVTIYLPGKQLERHCWHFIMCYSVVTERGLWIIHNVSDRLPCFLCNSWPWTSILSFSPDLNSLLNYLWSPAVRLKLEVLYLGFG